MRNIIDSNEVGHIKLNNDEVVDVDVPTANVLITILNALTNENKKKMIDLLSASAESFLKIVKFGFEQVE